MNSSDLPCEPESEIAFISCPLCGMNRILEKTGATAKKKLAQGKKLKKVLNQPKGRIRFDGMNLATAQIMQCRVPADKFYVIEGRTLAEIATDPRFSDLVEQMKSQISLIERELQAGTRD